MEITKTIPIDDTIQRVLVTITHGDDSYGYDANTPVLEGDELQAHCDANEFKWLNSILYQVYGRNIQFPTLEKWDEWISAGRKLEEITETITTPAVEAADAVMGMRQVTAEKEVETTDEKTEVVEVDGKYVEQTTTETVTDTINERQFTDYPLYNEDGTPQTRVVVEAVEAAAATEYVEAVDAVEAAEAVYEDRVVVHAEAERTETHVVQHAQEEITEERVTQEAREEIKAERQKYDEKTVSDEVTNVEFVKGEDGNYIRKETTETVERIERTPLYTDHPVVNEDGTPCVDANGEPVIHKCAVMEEYIQQTAQEEVRETFVIQEAREEKTETTVTPAVEEVTERVCSHEAVEPVVGVVGVEAAEAVEAVAEVTEPVLHSVPTMESVTISEATEAVAEQTETVVVRSETVVEKVAWKDTVE